MFRTLSSARFRTGANRPPRNPLTLTFVAIICSATIAFGAGNSQSVKIAPLGKDPKAKKLAGKILSADGSRSAAPAIRVGAAQARPGGPLAPGNDDCAGAIAIPDGPFPVVTAPVDISTATPQGSDDPDVCTDTGVDQTVWFSFTPSVSGQYIFSTCAGNGATGSTVYDTVIGVFDACSGGTTLVCNDTAAACVADVPGAPYVDQSTAAAVLTAGTTYYISAGHWSGDSGGVSPGFNEIAVIVDLSPAPDNDNCSNPTPLTLDRVTPGTTASATNDYRSPDTACFTGQGQLPTTSNGLDVVFSFTPPADGKYSFRYVQDDSAAALRGQSPVLYLADDCPAPDPSGAAPPHCIAAANRMNDQTTGNGNRSEEIACVPLTGGTPYYLFFDDRFTANPGGPLDVEVTSCVSETEPNDTLATATPFAPNSGCFMEGSGTPSGPAGDIDFYDLGAPPAGSKIFVGVDSAASNQSDFEMRLTTATDTLGYDDNDGTSWTGSNAPMISGVFAPGGEVYARVNSVPVVAGNEPYSFFARIETGPAQNESLPDPAPGGAPSNGSTYGATHVTGGGFVAGIVSTWDVPGGDTDVDCFRFVAHDGDNIVAFSDNNPTRTPGVITNVWPVIHTITGDPEPANFRFVGQVLRNDLTASPGTLTGTTPSVTSEFMHYRARYTGAYTLCFEPTADVGSTENPAPGAYPLPYQGSISLNCGPVPGPDAADISMTMTGPAGPVNTGDIVAYTIKLTNNDLTGVAQDVRLFDNLPAELVFISLSSDDGFGGNDTACLSLPTPGQNDAAVDCTNYSVAPGVTVTYTLSVQVGNCIGAGLDVFNSASISSYTTDANPANDSAEWTFSTSENGNCNVLLCDPSSCIADACKIGNHCDAGVCVSADRNCDDSNVCTDDSCDPTNVAHPCINDSSQNGDLCFDGNDCTSDSCDPVLRCVFLPTAAGLACNDNLNCTNNDTCDGLGVCVGHSVCDDGQPCTDDFADEANNCACENDLSFPGTLCDDGNACTTGTTCDGLGGAVANCNLTGGGTTVDCNDNNPCTDDSCDPAVGCVHTNNTAPCDDGSACTSGDICGGGVCGGIAISCDDANACTDDSCNPATGCVHANNTAPCDDGNACTSGDTCAGGTCNGGSAPNCNDGNPCTDDSCNPATGCAHANNTVACDDLNACTTNDLCAGGACTGGTALNCSDGNPCTDDSCDPATGCAHANNTAACTDGNGCTVGDVCSGGSCQPGAPMVCTAPDTCHTAGTCNPASGTCSNPAMADGSACDDASLCTTGETCTAGVCGSGTAIDCDDANDCTADGCNPATGCIHGTVNMDPSGFSADRIDGRDLVVLADAYASCPTDPPPSRYNPAANLDTLTPCIDGTDFHAFMTAFGQTCPGGVPQ
jgi:uncharacterized repeat protein (TIGR01451 family)